MAEEPGSERLMDALAAWYLALEDSQAEPDLLALCDGDEELARRARAVLNRTPALLDAFDVGRAEESLPRFDDFQLIHEIGSGGAGTVFVARQRGLARVVAVKVLRRDALGGEQGRARLRREAELMASLDHPCIAPVFAVGTQDDVDYIAMQLLEGPSLAALLERPDQRRAAEYARDVAAALELAHSAGVVHRDVKPANIILHKGRAVLVDFGLARSAIDTTLTREGAVPGTLAYIAPEQLQASRPPMDPRADVYSLGATLYELLAGRPPFDAARPEALMHAIVMEDAPSLRKLGIDRDLAAITEKALEKEVQRRYSSVAALGADLGRYLEGQAVQARPIGPLDRLLRRVRRNPRTAAGLVAGGVLVTIAAGLALGSEQERRAGIAAALESGAAALEDHELDAAAYQLSQARALGGAGAAYARLEARLRAMRAYDALFDLVITRGHLLRPSELATAIVEFETHAAELDTEIGPLLLAVARFHEGDVQQSLVELSRLAPARAERRSARVVRALLGEGDWEAVPPTPDDERAEEALLGAIAMHLAGRPLREQRIGLERALDRDPGNARCLLALSTVLSNEGRHGEALRTLRTIETKNPRLARRRTRMEINERVLLGDFDVAARLLERTPVVERTALDHYHAVRIALEHDGPDAARAYIRPIATSAGADVRTRMDHAELMGIFGDASEVSEAIEVLEQLVGEAQDGQMRQFLLASSYMLRVFSALDRRTEVSRKLPRETFEPLVAEGRKLTAELALAEPRARAHHALGLLLRFGDGEDSLEEARAELAAACERAPTDAGARVQLVVLLHHLLLNETSARRQQSLSERIIRHAEFFVDAAERGDGALPVEWPTITQFAADAASLLRTPETVTTWIPIYLESVARGDLPEEDPLAVSSLLVAYCAFAGSALPDSIERSAAVVIDCVPRLLDRGKLMEEKVESAGEFLRRGGDSAALNRLRDALANQ